MTWACITLFGLSSSLSRNTLSLTLPSLSSYSWCPTQAQPDLPGQWCHSELQKEKCHRLQNGVCWGASRRLRACQVRTELHSKMWITFETVIMSFLTFFQSHSWFFFCFSLPMFPQSWLFFLILSFKFLTSKQTKCHYNKKKHKSLDSLVLFLSPLSPFCSSEGNSKVIKAVERILSIWEERGVYSGTLITELRSSLIKEESPPETPVEQKSKFSFLSHLPLKVLFISHFKKQQWEFDFNIV